MSLVLAALAQAVSSRSPERIDLTFPLPCEARKSTNEEIVVCALSHGVSPYRLKQPDQPKQKEVPKAELELADGVAVGAEAEGADVGGFTSNRLMARVKIRF